MDRPVTPLRMTLEEYLAFDDASEINYEYHDGLVWEVDDPRRFPPRVPVRHATAAEYLAGERAGIRHEFIRGDVFRLAETSPEHDRVLANVATAVNLQLAGKPFRLLVKPRIAFDGMITYPDVAIFPETLVASPLDSDTWSNPVAILEVLNADLPDDHIYATKSEHYRSLASFREFLAIHFDGRYIVQYVWETPNRGWLRDHKGDDAVLTMDSVPVRLALGDVFGGT